MPRLGPHDSDAVWPSVAVPITLEGRSRSWWVIYAGTVLFIGSKRQALAIAQACAKEWAVKIEEA